ncbi:hypothetical protein EVAR_98819_1, partial [Eumeta japonica]
YTDPFIGSNCARLGTGLRGVVLHTAAICRFNSQSRARVKHENVPGNVNETNKSDNISETEEINKENEEEPVFPKEETDSHQRVRVVIASRGRSQTRKFTSVVGLFDWNRIPDGRRIDEEEVMRGKKWVTELSLTEG